MLGFRDLAVLEYGIHTLDRNGLGGLAVRHPGIGGETQVRFLVRPDFKSQQADHLINEHPEHVKMPGTGGNATPMHAAAFSHDMKARCCSSNHKPTETFPLNVLVGLRFVERRGPFTIIQNKTV